jgi:phosphate transport system permease protein
MIQPKTYTGYRRNLRTSRRVRIAERVSRALIGLGGLGTVVAVFGVFLFLASVVFPLFLPGTVRQSAKRPWSGGESAGKPLHFAVDEYRVLAWSFHDDGGVHLVRLDTGETLSRTKALEPSGAATLSAAAFAREGGVALGFSDGSIRLGKIEFETQFLDAENLPADVEGLKPGQLMSHDGGVVERIGADTIRHQKLAASLDEPIASKASAPSAVVAIDRAVKDKGSTVCALTAGGGLWLYSIRDHQNLFTGEVEHEIRAYELPLPESARAAAGRALGVFVTQAGDSVFVAWEKGRIVRIDTRDPDSPAFAEDHWFTEGADLPWTSLSFLIGRSSLLIGESGGGVRVFFPARQESAAAADGYAMVSPRTLPGGGSPVSIIAPARNSRLIAVAGEDGTARVFQATSAACVLEVEVEPGETIRGLTLAPKDDALVALTDRGIRQWVFDQRHPETRLATLFQPVWYERYSKPEHVWQSTSGDDAFEPKYGLWPLVFGTLKATFYSLLFGVPLALLAAIFTSEFLPVAWRVRIKTLIEFMASLPSVVLGFLAALVLAPIVQSALSAVLLAFVVVPLAFLLGAYLWQLLPNNVVLRFAPWRIVFLLALVPAGLLAAALLAPLVESVLFSGSLMKWLDEGRGSGFGGSFFFLLPLAGLLVAWLSSRLVAPRFRHAAASWPRSRLARADLLRFLAGVGAAVAIAALLAGLVTAVGWDPRGKHFVMDTYVQRNALVVGFIMGFAIIPIVYTIAEDALTAVPQHLRAASLGAGATPWQTAIRIVLPTAMSGLFSAVMVGMGRAVGETMIVLMAAGNTPVLEMNLFNGFRTLSANIAVELPEAVLGSTHYRTLFLAAFLLFAITFVVNTAAEAVRLRFRKRAYQL